MRKRICTLLICQVYFYPISLLLSQSGQISASQRAKQHHFHHHNTRTTMINHMICINTTFTVPTTLSDSFTTLMCSPNLFGIPLTRQSAAQNITVLCTNLSGNHYWETIHTYRLDKHYYKLCALYKSKGKTILYKLYILYHQPTSLLVDKTAKAARGLLWNKKKSLCITSLSQEIYVSFPRKPRFHALYIYVMPTILHLQLYYPAIQKL